MKAEYKRDMNHNYLILYGEEEVDTASYQVRMLVGNVIPSLLKCRMQGIDGKFMVYYDVTSKQSVSALYEQKKFSMEDLRLIFGGFVQVMEEMSEYLLNPGQLVIRPDYMFLDVEEQALFFCYLPGFERDVRIQFQELTEYILPQLDHEDEKAVMLGYGVYRRALEDSFHLEHIKEELYQVRNLKEDSSRKYGEYETETEYTNFSSEEEEMEEPGQVEEAFFWRDDSGQKKSEKNTRNRTKSKCDTGVKKRILWCLAGLIVLMGLLSVKVLGYVPGIGLEMIMGIVLTAMGTGMLGYKIYKRLKRNHIVSKKSEIRTQQPAASQCMEEETLIRKSTQNQPSKEALSGEKPLSGRQGKHDKEKYSHIENYGETVVLSSSPAAGPASLVSREPGELAPIYLQEEMTVIGKLEIAADAVINLPTVSRVHAKIRKKEEEYYLSDLNSRNGTSVNGRLLKGEEEYRLQNQDEVDFAQARYVFLK